MRFDCESCFLYKEQDILRQASTTDVPGCRDVVEAGLSGFLCRARDAADLAHKMKKMIQLTREERISMGKAGRNKVEREFDEKSVIKAYLDTLDDLFADGKEPKQ